MSNKINKAVLSSVRKSTWSFKTRKHQRIIRKFADKIGMVYFGYVNQHDDEHKIIGGFTTSSSHHDDHFCIGSVGGYSVSLVERSDGAWQKDGSVSVYNWLIMAFDLSSNSNVMQFFLQAKNHSENKFENLFLLNPNLKEVELGVFEDYNPEFTNRFTFYANTSDSVELQRLFPASTARVIGAHFWPLSIEQRDNVLYLYADAKNLSKNLLETMLENGLWLTGHIDNRIENI